MLVEQAVESKEIIAAFREHILNESEIGAIGFSSKVRKFALSQIPELSHSTITSDLLLLLTVVIANHLSDSSSNFTDAERAKLKILQESAPNSM